MFSEIIIIFVLQCIQEQNNDLLSPFSKFGLEVNENIYSEDFKMKINHFI